MTTVTYPGGPILTPTAVEVSSGAASSRSRVVSHEILDGPPVHTLRPAGPIRGTLALIFTDETDANDAFEVHRIPAVFTLATADRAFLNMTYVVTEGYVQIELDDETAAFWTVTVPFEEVI